MKNTIRWGLAAGLAAALGLFFDAQAQTSTGGSGSSGASGATGSGSRGDTGGPTPTGQDRSSAGPSQDTPQGGAAGTSSDSGARSGSTGSTGTSGATGSTATEPSGRQATGTAAGKVDKGLQERLERLHAMNQAEVQMGQLGAQNAQSPEVKQFAEHMQTDHQKADENLTQTAQTAGIASLEGDTFRKESEKHKKEMDKLQSKTGTDFDKQFMSRMVKDHESALKEAEKASKDAKKAKQTELASLLDKTHTGMKGHLDHAKQVQKALTGEGQRQGRRPAGATGGTGAGADRPEAGSRGDTGGPTPTGKDRSSAGRETTPQGGAAGTSSDSGERTTK